MRRPPAWIVAGCLYLVVAVAAWWHGWGLTWLGIGYGDPAQEVWFLAWLPHAIANGLDPFVSKAMFAPGGINLLLNTSILLPSLVLSPITVSFGPVVAFDAAVVLAPALSALAGFAAFRRFAPYGPAAFLGGLFYGFSPFLLHDLSAGHLHITTMVFPPLVLLVLDDIAVRRQGSPARAGVLLGLLVTAQFFTSLEVLAMTLILAMIGLALLAVRHRHAARAALPRVATGLVAAAATSGVLLAYPAWVVLAGPQRYRGSVFPDTEGFVAWLKLVLWPVGGTGLLPQSGNAYIGIPLVVLVVYGCLRWRSGALRFAATMALVALVLSFGRSIHITPKVGTGMPLPDALLARLPGLNNLLPIRFSAFVALFVAMGLAITVDQIRAGGLSSPTRSTRTEHVHGRGPGPGPKQHGRKTPAPPDGESQRVLRRRGLAGIGIGLAGLASPLLGLPLPFPVQRPPPVPAVYRSRVVSGLPRGSTVLTYPVPNGFTADEILWQAETGITWNAVAGYGFIPGPGPHPLGSLPAGPVTSTLGIAQLGLLPRTPDRSTVAAMRAQLRTWGVTVIIARSVGPQMPQLVTLLTEVTDTRPVRLDSAFVWTRIRW